jgi:acetolactate synthase-1/2/3 large subunit
VFCITGDGGLQMNIQELQTVVSEKLPIKIFVVNNKALGKIVEIQVGSYNQRMFTTNEESGYTVHDFEKVAKAYGIKAKAIQGFDSLDEFKEWLADGRQRPFRLLP